MTISTLSVTSGADDGQVSAPQGTGTLMWATTSWFTALPDTDWCFSDIDTVSIGTDTITAVDFYWYQDSYNRSGSKSTYIINLGGTQILSDQTNRPNGWSSYSLTAGQLSLINKTGKTYIYYAVGTAEKLYDYRSWNIRTYEYGSSNDPYLVITHGPAGGPTKMTILRV